MKIAVLGSKVFDSLEYHVVDSLKFLGHDIFHIDISDVIKIPYRYTYLIQKISLKLDAKIFQRIARLIIDQSPDLVICTYRNINPVLVKILKAELPKAKVVQLNPDAITTFGDQQIFASPYDAYFTKDPFIQDFMLNKMGLNTFYLPEAFNHRIHKTPVIEDRIAHEHKVGSDVVAFGTMYPYRANVLKNLIEKGVKLDLYGTADFRFPTSAIQSRFKNEYITGDRKAEVLHGAKIVFNNFHYAEVQCVNVKFFEIMGVGAFQICDYKEVIKDLSNVPTDAFTFRSAAEAVELVNYYLDKPEERHRIANQQLEYFHKNHTYDIRMQEMLNIISK